MIKPLWAYRGFILGSVQREFQSKYRNTMFGAAWNVLQPLAMIIVYTVIFAEVMRAKLPGVDSTFGYSIYLCAGVLTWGLFAEITTRAQNMFLDNAPKLLENIDKALVIKDYPTIKIAAHSLKPQLSYMGVKEEVSKIFMIEQSAGEAAHFGTLPILIRNLNILCSKAFSELKNN
jgi:hypothetical protein